jgi:hypothetical protein
MGVTGTYEGDQAELTGTALIGKRSLTLQVTLLRLTDLRGVESFRLQPANGPDQKPESGCSNF